MGLWHGLPREDGLAFQGSAQAEGEGNSLQMTKGHTATPLMPQKP